jgi:penicillin-binding protein 2
MKWQERPVVEARLQWLRMGVGAAFLALFLGYWNAQVLHSSSYVQMAESNSLRTLDIPPPRGLIRDRHGVVLAENQFVYRLLLDRERKKRFGPALEKISSFFGVPLESLERRVDAFSSEPSFRPVPLVENIGFEGLAYFSAHAWEFPELVIQETQVRRYPEETLMAHALGHVGEISPRQLLSGEFYGAQSGDVVGQMGLELQYDALLRGEKGFRRLVVDSLGREVMLVEEREPVQKAELRTSLDAGLAKAIREAFGGKTGAAVAMDPRNGEVLALLSLPEFDPNAFAVGIGDAGWSALTGDPAKPLQNRAIQGLYSPGSTFKLLSAAAWMDSRGAAAEAARFYCPGTAVFYNHPFGCWKAEGHGTLELHSALVHSCNIYFYNVGAMLGIHRLAEVSHRAGYDSPSGLDLPGELGGVVPSPEWKKQRFGQPWFAGETISVAIGQGALAVTPMEQAVIASAAANGGMLVTPHIAQEIVSPQGEILERLVSPPPRRVFSEEAARVLRGAMWSTVNEGGTGGRARIEGRDVCGKTGTAQTMSKQAAERLMRRSEDKTPLTHAWFVGFAPRDNPEIAVAVLVEYAGTGGEAAAPVAHAIFESYFGESGHAR